MKNVSLLAEDELNEKLINSSVRVTSHYWYFLHQI